MRTPAGEVLLSIHGPTAVIRLNDPTRRNVLSFAMVRGIGAAFDAAEANSEVRAVIVAGSGTAFSAGAELDTLLSAANGDFTPVADVYEGFLRVLRSPLLTVAAVAGPAIGAGMNLALACDIRVAGPDAVFDSRFARLHLHPGGGHMYLLQRAVGYQQAVTACLLSTVWSAEQAREVGLVLEVVDGDPVTAARDLLAPLGDLEPQLARRLMSTFRASAETTDHPAGLALETDAQQWSTTQPGFVAGVEAIKRRLAGA